MEVGLLDEIVGIALTLGDTVPADPYWEMKVQQEYEGGVSIQNMLSLLPQLMPTRKFTLIIAPENTEEFKLPAEFTLIKVKDGAFTIFPYVAMLVGTLEEGAIVVEGYTYTPLHVPDGCSILFAVLIHEED